MKFVDINSLSQFLKNLKNIFEPKGSSEAAVETAKVYTDNSLANLTADDIGVYVQSEEPTDAAVGDIWVDVDADSHLDPEIVIDSTLTQSGQAADAKVVGSKLSELGVYVTPQMFGAVADGVTDDSAAIQAAIDSDEIVFFPKGVYLINNTINLTNKERYNLYAENAKIIYSGSNYAFEIKHLVNANLNFGQITANNGGCVSIISDADNAWSQYVNISFLNFHSKTNCIYAYANAGWINEIRVHNGMFESGECGVKLVHDVTGGCINEWKFHNCGVEGVTTGFHFEAIQGAIEAIFIKNARAAEAFKILIKTVGLVKKILYEGTSLLYATQLDLSSRTQESRIIAPITESGGAIVAYDAIISGGDVLPNSEYYSQNYTNVGNGIFDLNAKFEEEENKFNLNYPYMWGAPTELKLHRLYGRKHGINKFTLRYAADSGSSLTVYDYQGNIIFNNIGNNGWCDLEFNWDQVTGWRVAVLKNIWIPVKTT